MADVTDIRDDAVLPPDFDAEWYGTRYPDVALSQLPPEEHYMKFGRLLGRSRNARAHAEAVAAADPQPPASLPKSLARSFGQGPLPEPDARPLRRQVDSPLVTGPADLALPAGDPAQSHVLPPNTGAPQLRAGGVEVARLAGFLPPDAVLAPVAAYCRMLGYDDPSDLIAPMSRGARVPETARRLAELARRRPACGAAALTDGPVRLANAWFADEGTLRLALTGPEGEEAGDPGGSHVLHVFQSPAHDPAELHRIGGARLTGAGPAFCDAGVFNPLMPVLLVLFSETGLTLATAVLPFPSLLRGGLHAAERAAWQTGPNPMAEVWRLSEALLAGLLPGPDDPPRAVTALSVDLAGATGAERLASPPVRHWLGAIFGLQVAPVPGSDPDGAAALAWGLDPETPPRPRRGAPPGLTLQLPADCLPTLAALVSRRLSLPEGQSRAAGPFLVAEAVSGRPRWSVSLPLSQSLAEVSPDLPILLSGAGTETRSAPPAEEPHWLAPVHLAIRMAGSEPVHDAQMLMPVAPDAPRAPAAGPARAVSVVLRATDPDRARRCLDAMAGQAGIRVAELLICHDTGLGAPAVEALQMAGEEICPGGAALLDLPAGLSFDPARIAARTKGAELCLIRDDVILYDPRTLEVLSETLAADPGAGTASCALLHEEADRKTVRIRTATAGLFPAHVSLIAAPRLGVTEPDCLEPLPRATYPVLANAFGLCLVRRAAIEAAGTAPGGWAEHAVVDLKFGLALAAAGWRSLCTTRVRAGTEAAPRPRDEIDPFGLASILPARWDALLSRVTVLQRLRG